MKKGKALLFLGIINTLLQKSSNYRLRDVFDKSCINYAEEYSWRNRFLEIVKEFEDGNEQF